MLRYLIKFPVIKRVQPSIVMINIHSCHISYVVFFEVNCVCTTKNIIEYIVVLLASYFCLPVHVLIH